VFRVVRNRTGSEANTARLMSQPIDRAELSAMFRDVFEADRRGAAILEHLLLRFGRTHVHVDGGIDAVLRTYRSAAHREILDYIVALVNEGNGVPDSNPSGEDDAP
jgi:hypothetical protein